MKRDVEDLIRDFIEWNAERGGRATVKVPPPPPVPRELAPLASYLTDMNLRLVGLELSESVRPRRRPTESQPEIDTGVHRVEELQRALEEARERIAIDEGRRHSSMTWRKRTFDRLLLSIIGVLILTIAGLVMKIIDSRSAPAPQPRQEERTR